MFFGDDDEGGSFMSPSGGGSRLQSLFGNDQPLGGANDSLKYTAPKQPKPKGEPKVKSAGPTPEILVAVAAHAYKYVDGKYVSQGKLGVAVLATPSTQDFKLLLYVTKQQQVTNAKITSNFLLTVQNNNYVTFYDDARCNWSLMFETVEILTDFTKQIVLAKALSAGPGLDNVVSLDITPGEGGVLETNDSAEVSYTGWLVTDNKYGQVFDTNVNSDKPFRLKVGRGKVIKGWDQGLLGMKRGGRRLLVIPPQLAYGSSGFGGKIPPNSTLIFHVEVTRVKLAKGDPVVVDSKQATPSEDSTADADLTTDDETSVKARSRSINEQIHTKPVKSDKAKLISRMAKMGQPMLPLGGAIVATEFSDEEALPGEHQTAQPPPISPRPSVHRSSYSHPPPDQQTPLVQQPQVAAPVPTQAVQQQPPVIAQQPIVADPVYTQYSVPPQVVNPAPQPVPVPAFVQNLPSMQRMALYQPAQSFPAQIQAAGYNLHQQQPQQQFSGSVFQQPPFPGSGSGTSSQNEGITSVFASETRQQNTEVRLAISKMADKVDRALEKLEHLQTQGVSNSLAVSNTMTSMESGVLMHNIQRIIQENDRVKKELFDQSSHIENQNHKISELLQRNQRSVEQGHSFLEQSNDTYKAVATQAQAKVLALEQEKVQLTTDLSSLTSQLGSVQLELSALRRSEATLRQELSSSQDGSQKQRSEHDAMKLQYAESEKRLADLSEQHKNERSSRKATESRVQGLLDEIDDLKTTQSTLERNLTERKRKTVEERERMAEEIEELKRGYEKEILQLKNKSKQQRSSTDAATAEQVAAIEAEINESWRTKMEKSLKLAEDRHLREMNDIRSDLGEKEALVQELMVKLTALKSSNEESGRTFSELQSKIDELAPWKQKYETLRGQAGSMKERYEARIKQLSETEEELENELLEKERDLDELRSRLEQRQTQLEDGPPKDDSSTEIKKVMNSVFQNLRAQFAPNEQYLGSHVIQALLNTIKAETLKLLQREATSQPAAVVKADEESESENESDEEMEDEPTDDDVEELPSNESSGLFNHPVIAETVETVILQGNYTTTGNNDGNPEVLSKMPPSFFENEDPKTGDSCESDDHIRSDVTKETDERLREFVRETTPSISDVERKTSLNVHDKDGLSDGMLRENGKPMTDLSSEAKDLGTGSDNISVETNLNGHDNSEVTGVVDSGDAEDGYVFIENRVDIKDRYSMKDERHEVKDSENIHSETVDSVHSGGQSSGEDRDTSVLDDREKFRGEHGEMCTDEVLQSGSGVEPRREDDIEVETGVSAAEVERERSNDIEVLNGENGIEPDQDEQTGSGGEIGAESDSSNDVTLRKSGDVRANSGKSDGDINPDIIPFMPSRTPPPLDERNSSLLDDDDEDFMDAIEDTFGVQFKPKTSEDDATNVPEPKKTTTSVTKPSKVELTDDDFKAKPPPLFGDDDDDDDLDWLS